MDDPTKNGVRALAAERAAAERTAQARPAATADQKVSLFAEVAYLDERLDELLRRLARDPGRAFRAKIWP